MRARSRRGSARLISLAAAAALGSAGCAGVGRGHGSEEPVLQPFQIRTIQRELELRGMRVEATGVWDEPTRAAVAGFQASKGLPSTGRPDYATLRELGVNPDPRINCEMNNTVDCAPPAN